MRSTYCDLVSIMIMYMKIKQYGTKKVTILPKPYILIRVRIFYISLLMVLEGKIFIHSVLKENPKEYLVLFIANTLASLISR